MVKMRSTSADHTSRSIASQSIVLRLRARSWSPRSEGRRFYDIEHRLASVRQLSRDAPPLVAPRAIPLSFLCADEDPFSGCACRAQQASAFVPMHRLFASAPMARRRPRLARDADADRSMTCISLRSSPSHGIERITARASCAADSPPRFRALLNEEAREQPAGRRNGPRPDLCTATTARSSDQRTRLQPGPLVLTTHGTVCGARSAQCRPAKVLWSCAAIERTPDRRSRRGGGGTSQRQNR